MDMNKYYEGLQAQNRLRESNISKGFVSTGLDDHLEKGLKGEGSRGGKIIGHTKSGKPIYNTANHLKHKDFSKEDHMEAAGIHHKKSTASDADGSTQAEHKRHLEAHLKAAEHGDYKKDEPDGSFGKTSSGKNIGTYHSHKAHKNFNAEDHLDALQTHLSARNKERDKISKKHGENKHAAQKEINDSLKVQYHSGEMEKHLKSHKLIVDTLKEYDELTDNNEHGAAALLLAKKFGTEEEVETITAINKRHKKSHTGIAEGDRTERDTIANKIYHKIKGTTK